MFPFLLTAQLAICPIVNERFKIDMTTGEVTLEQIVKNCIPNPDFQTNENKKGDFPKLPIPILTFIG